MTGLLYLFAAAFALCLAATPLLRNLFGSWGLLDRPDDGRKLHEQAVPHLGGVPIALSFSLTLGLFAWLEAVDPPALDSALAQILPLVPGALLVFAVGVLDDVFDLNPWVKFTAQIAAATAVFWAGLRVDGVAGRSLADSPWITFPLTLLWLVACTNAFNLIDGVDGLAAGIGFFATVTIFLSAVLKGDAELQILTAPLAGALLAFLRYNFNPATIFLGDSGAMLIGFLLGGFSIIWSHKSATILGMTAPVFALAFPIAEAALSVARRWLRGDPIFAADRGHIHHRLLEMGLGPRQVVLLLYAATGLGAAVSLAVGSTDVRARAAVVILFIALAWVAFQRLGYLEFASAKRVLLGGIRQRLDTDRQMQALARRLDGAGDLEAFWAILTDELPRLGFAGVRIEGATSRKASFGDATECWEAAVELPGGGRFVLIRRLGGEDGPPVEAVLSAVRERCRLSWNGRVEPG